MATKHAVSVFVSNGQDMAPVNQTPLPDLYCLVRFISLRSHTGQLISAFANDGPPHLLGPAIRRNREHHIRARVFTPAVVDGRIFVIIQSIGIRTTRNQRAAIRRAKCDGIAHQGIERKEHIVHGIGHQTGQRQGRAVTQIFPQQFGEFTRPVFRSRIFVAHDVRGTEEIRKRSVQGYNGQNRIGPHVVHAFGGRSEGLDGAVHRAASSHRQIDRVRHVKAPSGGHFCEQIGHQVYAIVDVAKHQISCALWVGNGQLRKVRTRHTVDQRNGTGDTRARERSTAGVAVVARSTGQVHLLSGST